MGKPYGISFTTNTLFVESIGKVLVRGQKREGEPVLGEITTLFPEETKEVTGKIVVTTKISEKQVHLLKKAKAVILQNHPLDKYSEEHLMKVGVPYITRADAALSLLKEGMSVRLEPALGLVFKGDRSE